MTSSHLLSWDKNDLLPITLQGWDKTVTFLNVLVQLVDKRVQLLPLLGGKLQCITGMNPLTQGTGIQQRNRGTNREDQLKWIKIQSWAEGQERRGFTSCRCLGRWFPQEQTGRGNLLGQTTAIQSSYWLEAKYYIYIQTDLKQQRNNKLGDELIKEIFKTLMEIFTYIWLPEVLIDGC